MNIERRLRRAEEALGSGEDRVHVYEVDVYVDKEGAECFGKSRLLRVDPPIGEKVSIHILNFIRSGDLLPQGKDVSNSNLPLNLEPEIQTNPFPRHLWA